MTATGQKGRGSIRDEMHERILAALAAEAQSLLGRTPDPGLYVVATPIGNLADISLRALWIIANADTVYCEDTRHTRGLLNRFGIHRGLRAYHDHSDAQDRRGVLDELVQGKSVALVSDAGTPLVSDPGYKLVRDALSEGHKVFAVPGPSASLAALTVSGLATDSFVFSGFLPQKPKARRERLELFATLPCTLIFFEAANRVAGTLAEMQRILGDRPAAIVREITKLNEDVCKGLLSELGVWAGRSQLRGEVTLVVGAGETVQASEEEIEARLLEALQTHSVKDAVRDVSERLCVARTLVYDLAKKLQRNGGNAADG